MKIKFLIIGLLGLISINGFAQESALKDAQENYDTYTVTNTQKLLAAKAKASIEDAKAAIDKASVNEKTATLPYTYALTGAIYAAMATMDTSGITGAPLSTHAKEAIKKAQAVDKKGDFKKLITDANNNLAIYFQWLGVKQYQAGIYDQAYQSFDSWNQVAGDTTSLYYSALAASNAGRSNPQFYNNAVINYNKLLATNFSRNVKIYGYLSTLYLDTRDTAKALKTLSAGVAKYPSNTDLRGLEIKFYLIAGRGIEILGKLEGAVAADPKNKELCYYAGLSYALAGDATSAKATKAKDEATKTANNKIALDYYSKAADYYKMALEIDPDYLDARLNLGEVMLKPAIDIYNQAYNLPPNATQKQYDDMRAKADVQFDLAKPYLLKAVDLYPKSNAALTNLWTYYRGKYEKANAAENKEKAAALKKQIDANAGKN